LDLAGCGLSDDPAQPLKWVFPATNLAPHSFLIVFASGKNTSLDPAGNLHASFRLNPKGGQLLLSSPDGKIPFDALRYPALDTDLAYGRNMDDKWCFLEPTPGQINAGTNYLGWLSPVTFSHPRGFYDVPFKLTITNNNLGATVLYSTDGSLPSLPYLTGISI